MSQNQGIVDSELEEVKKIYSENKGQTKHHK